MQFARTNDSYHATATPRRTHQVDQPLAT
jgi:hypothetical protein